ncbi:hypothetical protein GP486_006703 [Trichoglossum hirsutum]|uniref:Uncharacterized protein n=1 Tax=Trichoglossum hirsutum TaxID=265104 RepID=A0A9P8IE13_9PEZI|nr:hypothetical protein GP486_006703 [Trichoglossum hirsutum]
METLDRRSDGNGPYHQSDVLSEGIPSITPAANIDDGLAASPERETHDTEQERPNGSREAEAKAERPGRDEGPESTTSDRGDVNGEKAPGNINTDPAFNPTDVSTETETNKSDERVGTAGRAKHTKLKLQPLAYSTSRPKRSIRSAAKRATAGRLSKAQGPFAPRRSDLQIVKAHDEPQRPESQTGLPAGLKHEAVGSQEALNMAQKQREGALVAWITGRHVQKVKVVPKPQLAFPKPGDFVERDSEGEEVRVRWEHWLGHLLLFYSQDFTARYVDEFVGLPFDVNTLISYTERLIVASAPWQAWLMHVRRVYRWEDPAETSRWFALFVLLWYNSKIMTFVYGYIIYMVVRNYYFPSSIESLRESITRSTDREATAHKFSEFIGRYGQDDWLQPALDQLGPFIQIQIGDMANFLEVMYNLYHWKSPQKTVASLYFFITCFLISAMADMEFCMKIFWFIVGGTFFICWPISSRYPRYRYLVSPIKWVLWDIPTHPEWVFRYLRREAQLSRGVLVREKTEQVHNGKNRPEGQNGRLRHHSPPEASSDDEDEDWRSIGSTTSNLEDQGILSFKCECSGTSGKLTISSSGIYFTRIRPPKDELWRRYFLDLAAMSKARPFFPRPHPPSPQNR